MKDHPRLERKIQTQINGDVPLEYHLGCDYKLEKDGTLMAQPIRYINKILESYKKCVLMRNSSMPNHL